MFTSLVHKNRSYRRFVQSTAVSRETLAELVDLARHAPSGANRQPLKFWLSAAPETNARIFACLHWAGYLKDWPGPAEGERPAAYIILLGDTEIAKDCGVDHGIAAQTIMLGAVERGLGGCILASVERDDLRAALGIPERYTILLVLALGAPAETVVIEPVGADGNIRYWRDAAGVHYVPKRALDELIVG